MLGQALRPAPAPVVELQQHTIELMNPSAFAFVAVEVADEVAEQVRILVHRSAA